MRQFIIQEDLLTAVVSYMVSKPFSEVANFVISLQRLSVINQPEPPVQEVKTNDIN